MAIKFTGMMAHGCPPHDKGIIEEVRSVTELAPAITRDEAINKGLLVMIDKEIDDAFIEMVKNCALRPDLIKEKGKDLKVVYTPLNGTGAMPVSRALKEMGIEVTFVPEQKDPDGNSSNCKISKSGGSICYETCPGSG